MVQNDWDRVGSGSDLQAARADEAVAGFNGAWKERAPRPYPVWATGALLAVFALVCRGADGCLHPRWRQACLRRPEDQLRPCAGSHVGQGRRAVRVPTASRRAVTRRISSRRTSSCPAWRGNRVSGGRRCAVKATTWFSRRACRWRVKQPDADIRGRPSPGVGARGSVATSGEGPGMGLGRPLVRPAERLAKNRVAAAAGRLAASRTLRDRRRLPAARH